MSWKNKLFYKLPVCLQEMAVSIEAKRRNTYRRYGDFAKVLEEYDISKFSSMSKQEIDAFKLNKINNLIKYAKVYCDFYKDTLPSSPLTMMNDLQSLPILTKTNVREHLEGLISKAVDKKDLDWKLTSGSTGAPLKFCISRESTRVRYALYDNYCEYFGAPYGQRRARFSGAQVADTKNEKPPFWVFNPVFNQLQMSAYHINNKTIPYYLEKLVQFQPTAMTGYPHSLFFLASHMLETGTKLDSVKAIFTDSENFIDEHRTIVEKAFNIHCNDMYGMGELSGGAFQCPHGQYVETFPTCIIEILDKDNNPVAPGEQGRVVVTDLVNYALPFIRYDSGDVAVLAENCDCEWKNLVHIKKIIGRLDDMVLTPKGRWIGRLSHVTKPAIGVLESQIIQNEIDQVVIDVVPGPNFKPESMKKVLEKAHEFLGDEMNIEWRIVESIPRNPNSHKIKHVVRNPKIGKPDKSSFSNS